MANLLVTCTPKLLYIEGREVFMEIGLAFVAGGLLLGAVVVYVALMIFFPEWVGITGKVALNNEKSHQKEESKKDG